MVISGVAGLSHESPLKSVATFTISALRAPSNKYGITAVVVPRVTCDLPLRPIPYDLRWNHLSNIRLADPNFGLPGRVDILLGVDVFVEVLKHGRRIGPPGFPSAFETELGWVLAGGTDSSALIDRVTTHHASLISSDEILLKFWEMEEAPMEASTLTAEERSVVKHFGENYSRSDDGRFIVPLPRKPESKDLGESRSQAVRRFLSLERNLRVKGQFEEFNCVMQEYLEMGHAELVPIADLEKSVRRVFLLTHACGPKGFKYDHEGQSRLRCQCKVLNWRVIDVDVLLRFRLYPVALTTDVSRMYRAVELASSDRDFHRFVWRSNPDEPLKDYRMTRVTFGVSASSFAANMSVKQNAIDLALKYPLAAKTVNRSFYVDDGLAGADSTEDAIELQSQLQNLFSRAGFLLRKWNSNEPDALQHLSPELKQSQAMQAIPQPEDYTKTLGIEWNTSMDHFRLTVAALPPLDGITKRVLVSDIAKTFDVLGWFSPAIIKIKILLQQLWELKVGWDDLIPQQVHDAWLQWRSELKLLSSKHIPRCYYPRGIHIASRSLQGFCDASENAYAGVVYLRTVDSDWSCVLYHVKEVFGIPPSDVYAWTDSTIVLNWLDGSPRRFKTFVGNRISSIMELISPTRWNHVNGTDNPADCASRGLFPSELLAHGLWWNGPDWIRLTPEDWP